MDKREAKRLAYRLAASLLENDLDAGLVDAPDGADLVALEPALREIIRSLWDRHFDMTDRRPRR